MDEEGAQVAVAAFADAAQSSNAATGVLARRQAEPAGEVASRGKTQDISYRRHQRGGGDQTAAVNVQDPGDDGQLGSQPLQLAFGLLDALLELSDLGAS